MINGYTESEICMLYREAKNKRLQVEILTQLTGLRTFEIERILTEGGYLELDEDKKKIILEYYEQGLNDSEISRAVGIAQSPVSKFLRSQGLPSHGRWKTKKEEIKVSNETREPIKDTVPHASALEKLKKEKTQNVEELKEILTKSIPAPEDMLIDYDIVEELSPQQYYELAKLTLQLLKAIWEG